MEYVDFGKTGLKVSVAGLGCGGHSCLGQHLGASMEESADIVRSAMDQGVNMIDTAAVYGTENIVGLALKTGRDKVVLSTKASTVQRADAGNPPIRTTPDQLRNSLENSLAAIGTDYIDILHLHAVGLQDYQYCFDTLVPEILKFRDEGKIRFIGVSERFIQDPNHDMLARALKDDIWDVMMVGFNLLNPSARTRVFTQTIEKGIATLDMFAVRSALSNPEKLIELVKALADDGLIDQNLFDMDDPVGFLIGPGRADTITEAAYRFCRHEPGVDVVLTGTGNLAHLQENLASICRGPLSDAHLNRLRDMFGHINSVSGN